MGSGNTGSACGYNTVWKDKVLSTQCKGVTCISTVASFKENWKIWEGHNSTRVLGDETEFCYRVWQSEQMKTKNGPIILLISSLSVKENFQKLKFPLKNRMIFLSFSKHGLLKHCPIFLQATMLPLWSCPTRARCPLDRDGSASPRFPNFPHVIVAQEKMKQKKDLLGLSFLFLIPFTSQVDNSFKTRAHA